MSNPTSILPEENASFDTEEEATGRPELAAWQRWKDRPTPETMGAAIRVMQPTIDRAVSRFPQFNHNVLGGEAKKLTIQALKTYDPTSGAALKTHVFNHLLPLGRRGTEMSRIIAVPRSQQQETGRYVRTLRDFQEQNNREPSDGELMDLLQVNGRKLHSMRRGANYEMPEGSMEDLPDMKQEDPRLNMWVDLVYHDLNPRDQKIMDYKMGRNGHPLMSSDEIAVKLGIHPTLVNRIAKDAAEKILGGLNSHKEAT